MAVEERSVLYINLIIHDASEAVKAMVTEKIEESNLPPPIKNIAAKHAPNIAGDLVPPSKLAEEMGQKLCKKIPKKMKNKGLTVDMQEVFRHGAYVVIQMQILHVDSVAMANMPGEGNSTNKEKSNPNSADDDVATNNFTSALLQWTYSLVGAKNQNVVEKEWLPNVIQAKMETAMNDMLGEKMQQKHIKAEALVLAEAKQARYFYAKLKEVIEVEEAKRRKNPIKEIIKKKKAERANKRGEQEESDDSDSD